MSASREKRRYRVISPEGGEIVFEILIPTAEEISLVINAKNTNRSPPEYPRKIIPERVLLDLQKLKNSAKEKILKFGVGKIFSIFVIIAIVCFLGFIVTPKWLIPWLEKAAEIKKGGEYLKFFFLAVGIWIVITAVASIVTICRNFDEKSKAVLTSCFYGGAIGIGGLVIAAGVVFLVIAIIEAVIELVKVIIGLFILVAIIAGIAESNK